MFFKVLRLLVLVVISFFVTHNASANSTYEKYFSDIAPLKKLILWLKGESKNTEDIKPEELKPEELKPEELKPEELKPEVIKPEELNDHTETLSDRPSIVADEQTDAELLDRSTQVSGGETDLGSSLNEDFNNASKKETLISPSKEEVFGNSAENDAPSLDLTLPKDIFFEDSERILIDNHGTEMLDLFSAPTKTKDDESTTSFGGRLLMDDSLQDLEIEKYRFNDVRESIEGAELTFEVKTN